MKALIIGAALAVMMTGCGGGGGGSSDGRGDTGGPAPENPGSGGDASAPSNPGDTSSEKTLFSEWAAPDGKTLDLSAGELNADMDYTKEFVTGEQCGCDLQFNGDGIRASYVLNSCVFVPSSGSSDPGCDAQNHVGTYWVEDSQLTMCDSGQNCTTFQ